MNHDIQLAFQVYVCFTIARVMNLCLMLLSSAFLSVPWHLPTPSPAAPDTRNQFQGITPELAAAQKKADSGDIESQLFLAKAYAQGNGVPIDTTLAAKWFRKAADQGNAVAEDNLGVMFVAGDGVEKDKAAALQWYRKAARQRNARAMFHLGTMYYNGDGVPIDDAMAYAWFFLAREAGDQLGTEAAVRAESELKPETMIQGLANIARQFDSGEVLAVDQERAARWWLLAAQRGNQDAKVAIAGKYLNGQGVNQDYAAAKRWCESALKEDKSDRLYDPRAAYCLGIIYDRGLGVAKELKTAREWYERSAAAGNIVGSRRLAQMCADGEGGKQDKVKAALILIDLVRHGDKDSIPKLTELGRKFDKKEWEPVQKQLRAKKIDPATIPGFEQLQQP